MVGGVVGGGGDWCSAEDHPTDPDGVTAVVQAVATALEEAAAARTSPALARAAENLRRETKVSAGAWLALAGAWNTAPPSDVPAFVMLWSRDYLLTGPPIDALPPVLGRVTPLARFRDFLRANYDEFRRVNVRDFMEEVLALDLDGQRALLSPYLLGGRFVYWSTFSIDPTAARPFAEAMMNSRESMLSELGLPPADRHNVHLCIEYDLRLFNLSPSDDTVSALCREEPTLRFPTCVEAYAAQPSSWNPYFRTEPTDSGYGWTESWDGRTENRPEGVHEPTNGSVIAEELWLL